MDVFFLFPGRFYFDSVVVIGFRTDEGLYRAKIHCLGSELPALLLNPGFKCQVLFLGQKNSKDF